MIRKAVEIKRKTKKLAAHYLAVAESGGAVGDAVEFSAGTLTEASEALERHEIIEVRSISLDNPKRVPDIAYALADELAVAVVQLKKHSAVLYRAKPDGIVQVWGTGLAGFQRRPGPRRDIRGKIIGRVGDEGDVEEDDEDDEDYDEDDESAQ